MKDFGCSSVKLHPLFHMLKKLWKSAKIEDNGVLCYNEKAR